MFRIGFTCSIVTSPRKRSSTSTSVYSRIRMRMRVILHKHSKKVKRNQNSGQYPLLAQRKKVEPRLYRSNGRKLLSMKSITPCDNQPILLFFWERAARKDTACRMHSAEGEALIAMVVYTHSSGNGLTKNRAEDRQGENGPFFPRRPLTIGFWHETSVS
jgi:hypothetical protein